MDMNHCPQECDVLLDLPYPPIQPNSCRPDYARALLSNAGGRNSEMGAVSLYFYNSVVLDPCYADLARCFHKISVVEMHHLNIFASFANKMGLDPRLWEQTPQGNRYWSPAYNCYPRTPRALVENSLQAELAAIEKYSRQAEIICDDNIRENLNRIILDEQQHVKIFREMLEGL